MKFAAPALVAIWIAGLATAASAVPTTPDCAKRVNDTPAKVAECIARDSLWRHLSHFQTIADNNPGRGGHPNRNTGTPGYKASVDYVAGLMHRAGYQVSIQSYVWRHSAVVGVPTFSAAGLHYRLGTDWSVAPRSGSGRVTALVQPAGNGCEKRDFSSFVRGHIALLARDFCPMDTQVANATARGASAIVFYDSSTPAAEPVLPRRQAVEYSMESPARVPVLLLHSNAGGAALSQAYMQGPPAVADIDVQTRPKSDNDYNVIADSPFGDPHHIVVVDAHLDSICGAGMLDNASGSTSILETALALARTKTVNRLRYIWFGGEELGLLGSKYYTRHMHRNTLKRIVFDIDVDVTATPNFDVLVADPAHAHAVHRFPPNVVPQSRVGNRDFAAYFRAAGIPSRNAWFGNDGTDSLSFSLVGVPNSGILTQQDCCKHQWEVDIWGGYLGNYEGKVPGRNGGCVDYPKRWCDNLSNNDPFVLESVSKAVAYVTLELANDKSLGR